jgi:hypothetical protein
MSSEGEPMAKVAPRIVFKVLTEDANEALGIEVLLNDLVAPEAAHLVKIETPFVRGVAWVAFEGCRLIEALAAPMRGYRRRLRLAMLWRSRQIRFWRTREV